MAIRKAVKSESANFKVRRIRSLDLDRAVALTRAEGWPHTKADWLLHAKLGEGWVACDSQGTVIGTALRWDYAEPATMLGLIVVDRAWRGKGVGGGLIARVLADTDSRYVRLTTTEAGFPLYQACGFRTAGFVAQHQGIPVGVSPMALPERTSIRPVQDSDIETLYQLDTLAFGAGRYKLLIALKRMGDGLVLERDGAVTGFVMGRAGGKGLWLGPLVADSQECALLLLSHRLEGVKHITRIDVPEDAGQIRAWLQGAGMEAVDQARIMDRGQGQLWRSSTAKSFALVSQGLG